MKKLITILMILIMVETVMAVGNGGSGNGGGIGSPSAWANEPTQVQANSQNQNAISTQSKAQNSVQLQEMIQERERIMEQERLQKSATEQKVYQNQNRVREAVHALLSSEGLLGGIGPQVSAIATQFDNSVAKTIVSESKIQRRSSLARFFIGGDRQAASELNTELAKTDSEMQELKTLINSSCDCDSELKTQLQAQLSNMEQERLRLRQLAQEEIRNKGMIGWLWKWGDN